MEQKKIVAILKKLVVSVVGKEKLDGKDIERDYETYMDSIIMLMLITKIEKKFKIEIVFEDLKVENLNTFSKLTSLVEKYVNE